MSTPCGESSFTSFLSTFTHLTFQVNDLPFARFYRNERSVCQRDLRGRTCHFGDLLLKNYGLDSIMDGFSLSSGK